MRIPKRYKKSVDTIDAWYDGYKAGETWAMKTFRQVLKPKEKK